MLQKVDHESKVMQKPQELQVQEHKFHGILPTMIQKSNKRKEKDPVDVIQKQKSTFCP